MAKNRRLEIILSIINDEAKRARAEEMQGFRQVAREADRQAKLAAKAQADATRMAADAQAKAARQQVDVAARSARQQADLAARSARQSADTQAKEATRLAAVQIREAEKAARQQVDIQARAARQATEIQAREAMRAANVQAREADRAAREQTKAQNAAAKAAKKAADDQAKAWAKLNSKADGGGMVTALGEMVAGFSALKIASAAIDFMVNSLEAARNTINQSIVSTREYRDAVLELAALKDRLGNSTTETKEQLLFRAQTLQGRQEAIKFQEAALGSGQASIMDKQGRGLISQGEFDKAMVLGGQFQTTEHGAADTHGRLVGMLPLLMGRKGVTGDEVFQKEQQLFNVLQKGGATFTSGTNQLMKLSPLVTSGLYRDVADPAALLSMFSLSNAEGAGENVEQFTRATVGGLGKMRGVKLEGDSEKIGEYLKGLGANNQMDPIQIGKLISGDLAKQEVASKGKGEVFNAFDYLQYHGYGNQEERMALLGFHGSRREFNEVFEPLSKQPPDIGPTKDAIRGRMAVDPGAQAAAVDVSRDLKDVSIAMGPNEYYRRVKEMAFNQLQAEGVTKFAGNFDDWDKAGYMNGPWKSQIINRADEMMRAEAKKAGVYIPQTGDSYMDNGVRVDKAENPLNYSFAEADFMESDQEQAQQYYKYGMAIAAKGGNPLPGMDKLVELMTRVAESVERQEKAGRAGQKAPVPMVNPRPLPGRP